MAFLIALTCLVILIACWPVVACLALAAVALGLIAGLIWLAFTYPGLLLIIPAWIAFEAFRNHQANRAAEQDAP